MKTKWTKSPPELIARFKAALPGAPAVERPMFGYPAAFVNGNMFASLFQDRVVLRLAERDRAAITRLGAAPFAPMPGRPMREYVTAPPSLQANAGELRRWIARAFAHGRSLPPKAKKPAKTRPPTTAKRATAKSTKSKRAKKA